MAAVSSGHPSITRALRGLTEPYQNLVETRYRRILPFLLEVMRPSDIAARNRTWPGVSPEGKKATSFLTAKRAGHARRQIKAYARKHDENGDELWLLFYAYCRYGLIGLIEALPSELPPLVPDALQELAIFHRLAKHPRSEAGIYIRSLLDQYADDLGLKQVPDFVARYAWTTNQRLERWFAGEWTGTEHVTKTFRRLNRRLPFPHQVWQTRIRQLPFMCHLSDRHRKSVQPWLIWMYDVYTRTLMGYRLCATEPVEQDVALALRWSIWHFNAAWWSARGVPDTLIVPEHLAHPTPDAQRALAYLRTTWKADEITDSGEGEQEWACWPDSFGNWLASIQRRAGREQWSIAEVNGLLLDYLAEWTAEHISTRSTGVKLRDENCSLPWSRGIGAVLLLPSAGRSRIQNQSIVVKNVPYDIPANTIDDGCEADVYYDPDDARHVFLVAEQANVYVAPAHAFEHHLTWVDLLRHDYEDQQNGVIA